MMRVWAAALLASFLLAPSLGASRADSVEFTLEVSDAVAPGDEPFRPPARFRLRPGSPDMPWLGSAKDAFAGVRRWQIQIFDFDERKVRYLQGAGAPPEGPITWDGVASDGRPLRDGFYTARLVWVDAAGAPRRSEPVKVSLLTPPGVNDFAGPRTRVFYMSEGMVIRLAEELTFAPDQWAVRPQAKASLEKIADFLQRYPRHRLSVVGHADSTGAEGGNRELALKRARAIHRVLLRLGVDDKRVRSESRGADEPIASNDSPEGREQNRRVEIILSKSTI